MNRLCNICKIILFLIFLFLFLSLCKNFKNKYENFDNNQSNENNYLTYYRCKDKMLGKIMKDIFDTNNITQTDDNWNIYVPCGYNNVENELKTINIKDNNSDKYIFGVNGCDTIVSKNKIWECLVKCYGREKARTLMPESYILDDPNEMMEFRRVFNPNEKAIYILKKNVQRKEGLKLTRDFFEILNGADDEYRVAQKYITDLYLINDRKINLRIYLLIVIKNNNVYFYLSRTGKCIYTNKKYNDNDLDFESNITSYHLDMSVYNENPRDFEQLRKYIDIKNKKEENGKRLFNNIELLMKEVSLCLSKNFYQSKNIKGSITFQLFGADVIFDNELHPYLLEFNKGPDMSPRDVMDENMKNSVQSDMFKTVGIIPENGNNSFFMIYKNAILK